MNVRRSIVGVSSALAAAALMAGCGASPSKSTTTSGKPVSGGTIVYALPAQTNITWFFPLANLSNNSLYNFQLIDQLYKPLFWINHKYGIDWKDSVARKVSYNKAGTVYHVFMNPQWKWSDGKPVTSADVLWTWKIIQAVSKKNAPSPWPYVGAGTGDIPKGVQSVTANGKYEFTVTLKKPANQEWFIYNGLSQFMPLPEQAWNRYPNNMTKEVTYLGKEATHPSFDKVVDGPYVLAKAVSNQAWTLKPNAHYGGSKAYDTVVVNYEASNEAEFSGLRTGTVQVGYVDLSQYKSIGQLTNDRTFVGYPLDMNFMALNFSSKAKNGLGPVFKQLYVRQAMEEAINQPAIDKSVYQGFGPPQYGPISTTPATQYLDPALKKAVYPYNPKGAKKLLEKHGWTEKNGVMTNKKGQQLKFTVIYSSGTQTIQQQMQIIAQDYANVGINITLKPMSFSTMLGIIGSPANASKWDAVSGLGIIYGGTYPSGEQDFATGGGNNLMGFSNSEENALIQKTTEPASSRAVNFQNFYAYEDYTAKELPVLWLNNTGQVNAVAKNVHGVNASTINNVTGYPLMQYWWTSK